MSPRNPLRRGDTPQALTVDELSARADALAGAVETGGERLERGAAHRATAVVDKVRERNSLVGGHTVVALAGATGSGKSSLFNALVGADIARVGQRRPTTSTPTAAVWGTEPAGALLDWLSVGTRHQVTEPGDLDGLVLVDLPDFDSRESAHREEAQRILELVDVFVWVTDPQKYADAVLHDDYVAVLRDYGAVTIVVLNQVDRLPPGGEEQIAADLARLLERDGLQQHEVIGTSTRTGVGLDALRSRLHDAVEHSDAARHRLGADLRTAAGGLLDSVGESGAGVPDRARDELVDALARSAGVPTVVDAVARDFRMESWARTGWPFTRWVRAVRPAPLKRLRLDRDVAGSPDITEQDVRAVLGRSSIPSPAPAARAAVDLAARRIGTSAGEGLPTRWADAVADAARPADADLADELDQAVLRTSLRGRKPLWWAVLGPLQVVLALAALAGLVWLVVIALAGWLQLPDVPTADIGPFAMPFLLLVGGLLAGLLLAAIARWLAAIGARKRAATVDKRLRRAIGEVGDARVVEPVEQVLSQHDRTRAGIERALG
ncbi:GTPase family protein [Janibacter indicus]|uniref:GTP-binding protein EngB required for normal cell division n=1 Tax=Janibacter indicus TaxID=857417 RepID=A0A1W2CGN1_9MICO|nr:YfjP family GTPase [Janibacter indicus]SMC84114.1 GTP-binding protein EngB required for normal cell division [Janibacter indicus]